MDLGLASSEFWELTFEELDALIERRHFLDRRLDYRSLLVVCAVYNAQRTDKKQKVWKPEDFLPSVDGEPKPEAPRQSVISALDAFAMARWGNNNQGELEARERIAKEKEEAEALGSSVGTDS